MSDIEDKVQEIYEAHDGNLHAILQDLFDQGHDEVDVNHPTEGIITVTREFFETLKQSVRKSPAKRLMERKRIERQMKSEQIRFRTAMASAKVHTVDTDDDETFGIDVDGVQMGIEGCTFISAGDYLPGIELHENEFGCFYHEDKHRAVRACSKNSISDTPAGGGEDNTGN